jgi:outer membrane lipoprotein-sorting protein
MDIEETGEILFKDDLHLKWTYLYPDLKIFLIEKDLYKFYDEENEQLTIGKIKEKNKQWIWQLFFSDEILQFTTTEEKSKRLFLRKEDSDPPLDIEIVLNSEYLPIKVIENNPSGIKMVFYFNNYKKQVKIPTGAFDLKIPKGVDIVYETDK